MAILQIFINSADYIQAHFSSPFSSIFFHAEAEFVLNLLLNLEQIESRVLITLFLFSLEWTIQIFLRLYLWFAK